MWRRRGRRLIVIVSLGAIAAVTSAAQQRPADTTAPASASGEPATAAIASDDNVRALIDAGRYIDAEKLGRARVAALDTAGTSGTSGTTGTSSTTGMSSTTGTSNTSDTRIADTLELVVLARHLGRRLTQGDSVALAERALRIKETAFGADDPRLASPLILAGLARAAHRQQEDAVRAATRALAMRERTLGADHIEVANALNAIAWIQRIAGQYSAASDAATRALAVARRAEQPAGRETAAALSILAYVAHSIGDIDSALRRFQEGVEIEERVYGAAHPAFLYSLLQLGNVYWDAGDLDRSREARDRAVRGLERIPGSEYRLAFELMLHSNWMNRIGDYAASLALAERAAAFAERAAGSRSPLAAAALDQVAITQSLLGNHAAAIDINRKAVALWTESQGPDSQHTATAWRALASAYEEGGRLDEALEAIERALTSPALTQEPIRYSSALLAKASLLVTRERFDEARTVLTEFRRVNEKIDYNFSRADLASAFALLGRIERRQDGPARAVPSYREALRIFEETLGPANPSTTVKRAELAGVLAEAGEYGEARTLLAAGERASLDHLRLLARALPDQAALRFAATRTSGLDLAVSLAAAAANRGAGAARRREPGHGGDTGRGSGAGRSGDTASTDIDLAFDLLIRGRTVILDEMAARHQAVTQGAGDAALRERWATLNRARTRLANLIVRGPEQQPVDRYQASVDRARTARDSAERDLAEASTAFRQELERTRAGATEVRAHLPAGAALVSYVRYTPQPIASNSSRPAAASRTAPHHAASAQARRAPAVSPEARSPEAASFDGASPQAYAAFVARAGRPVTIVPLGGADRIDAAIGAWRDRIRGELTSAGLASRRTETLYREAGASLRSLVWDPVQAHLGKAATVFIVPDGALHLVDLSTLPTGEAGYLVDAPAVLHYVLAERDLLQRPPPPAGDSLLALGAPDFDNAELASALRGLASLSAASNTSLKSPTSPASLASPALPESPASPTSHTSLIAPDVASARRGAGPCEASLASRFEPLPATVMEVQHIASLWRLALPADPVPKRTSSSNARDVVLLAGAHASETALKTLAPGRRVLHVATHGFFLDRDCTTPAATATAAPAERMLEESPLLRSGLVLAGANGRARTDASDDADDGILTAEEIAGLDLSGAQWAVLSACDTGRGDWQAGEGVLGLRRAFQMAGARTVILSLWPVLDTVTARWMTELYRYKWASRRMTTAAAVRAANRTLLASRRAKGESTHPLYWSGFIATGDWR